MENHHWGELERAAAPRPAPVPRPAPGPLWLSPRGRISRSTYWLGFVLPIWALQMLALVADATLGLFVPAGGFGAIYLLVSLGTMWPGFVGTVKRLHDLGYSGWLVPGVYGSALAGGIGLAVAIAVGGVATVVAGIAFAGFALAALWISIQISFFRGTVGPNEYGPDPVAA